MKRRDVVAFLPAIAGDRALLARLAAGEEAAHRECYETHAPALTRLLVRVLRNRAQAEEVLQETFVAAFRAQGRRGGRRRGDLVGAGGRGRSAAAAPLRGA